MCRRVIGLVLALTLGGAMQISGADLHTAKTIYVEPLPNDLHRHIAARLAEKGPYKVLLDKEKADLWMIGTVTVELYPTPTPVPTPQKWENVLELARILSGEEEDEKSDATGTWLLSVMVVPRGSDEILWGSQASAVTGLKGTGPEVQVAKEIVKKLITAKEKKRKSG